MADLTSIKHEIALGEAYERLRLNRDFQFLIEQIYLKDYPAELVLSLGMESNQCSSVQKRIKKELNGIGSFYKFLTRVRLEGDSSKQALAAYEAGEFGENLGEDI